METQALVCVDCSRTYELVEHSRCPHCGGPLSVEMGELRVPQDLFRDYDALTRHGMWAYQPLLPVRLPEPSTLGEGNTPLIRVPRLASELGLPVELWVKDETRQPTGAFKDRPLSVAINKAVEFGKKVVVTSSSGNAAGATAVFAARAGLDAVVVVPAKTPAPKLAMARAAGARILKVNGDVSDCVRFVVAGAERYGWYDVTTTFANPYSVEGNKTIAYEMALQMDFQVPDWIVVPVGAGPLLVGIYKGFKDLQRLGLIQRLPRMVAAQAEGCAPIAEAFRAGKERVLAWEGVNTVAGAIADPLTGYEQDGTYTLNIVRESGGVALAVDDGAIREAAGQMSRLEGIYVEVSTGSALAAVAKMWGDGIIEAGQSCVLIATGHGLKHPHGDTGEPEAVVDPDPASLDAWVEAQGLAREG